MPITIELPPEDERRLNDLAAQTGREVDFYLPEIIQCGLEGVKVRYLAEAPPSGIPTLESLRAKYDSKKDALCASGKDNLCVRIRRGLSWMERAQKEANDLDAAFIFQWIGFEALYSVRPSSDSNSKTERDAFLTDAVGVGRGAIYNRVIASESKTILLLVANAYVFKSFWKRYYDEWSARWKSEKWADSLLESVERTIRTLEWGEISTLGTLVALFNRLYELRNQLVHGGTTWEDGANRDQVGDGARIMSRLLPVFLDLVMDHPDRFNNSDVASPPPHLDTPEIKAEHKDYIRRLSDMADNVPNLDYREYLREAIAREQSGNDEKGDDATP